MSALPKARPVAARLLDLLALAALIRAVWQIAGADARLLETRAAAELFLPVPLLLLLRTLIETSPPVWASLLGGPAGGEARVFANAAAGTLGGALAAVVGWAFLHPHSDYPSVGLLAAGAVAAGLPVAIVVGLLSRLSWRGTSSAGRAARGAFFAGAAMAPLAVRAWNPAADWVFASAGSLGAGLAVGAAVFVSVSAALLALSAAGSVGKRIGIAAVFAIVPLLLCGWIARPLDGIAEAPDEWPHAVVLVTIDTLRADHLGVYGYHRDTSPKIDALAVESVLFERAYAAMPTTDPSHTAILTGMLPRTSGVTRNGQPISPAEVASLASWFRYHGYRTGAISSRTHLDPDSLLLPGFQTFSVPVDVGDAVVTRGRATTWIERHGDRPFFLWVHFWDPHSPYEPPPEHAARFVEEQPHDYFHGIYPYADGRDEHHLHSPEALRYAISRYDAEIRDADEQVGRLLDETAERFGPERVLTVLTADHGETLDEHDHAWGYAFDHGKMLARHELHVPLLFHWPGRLPAGLRVGQAVSNAAIFPTVAALLGDPAEADLPDFAALLDRSTVGDAAASDALLVERRSFADPVQLPFFGSPELGVIHEGWLYVENPERGTFLYEMEADPRGEVNRVEPDGERAAALARRLRDLAIAFPPAASLIEEMDPEKIEALRSLGYIQ